MNAIALLKQDHAQVAALFEQYESANDDDRTSIAGQICQLLTLHARIEEEIFYPRARAALIGDAEQIDESVVEHESVKALVVQIEAAQSVDPLFNAKVRVLNEYVAHHVRDEELELFPRLQSTSLDLTELGQVLGARKAELMVQLGISSDDAVDEAASGGGAATSARPPITERYDAPGRPRET